MRLQMIMSLFRRGPKNVNVRIVDAIYARIVAAARQPVFYRGWGVPDTPLGRYECIGLHMILFLHRTRDSSQPVEALAQDVLDEFFKDVDYSIRELGVGDQSVPKRMKRLARMFYGRMGPYWSALDEGDGAALANAVSRNIAPDSPESLKASEIAGYMMRSAATLAGVSDEALLSGSILFSEIVQ